MGVAVPSHYQDLTNQNEAGHFGMWVFVASEILFFAALFALYAGYRVHYLAEFEQAATHSKLVLGTANTYILITSSLFVALSVDRIRHGSRRAVLVLQALTIACGCLFLILKATEYAAHIREGVLPGEAYHYPPAPGRGAMMFFTLYYVMTGLHALHVAIGIGLFTWLFVRTKRGRYSAESHLGIELTGLYWHFVDLVWLFLWPLFYLVH